MTQFQNKTVLITGASRGIGAATARHFATEGANVVMLARNADSLSTLVDELDDAPGELLALAGDVSRYLDLEKAVAKAQETFGSLDILVNNAGVIDPIAHIADSDPDTWDTVVDINFKGVYHGIRAALPAMLDAGGGTIVNISSGAATSALEGWSHYCATKAGVLMLTACTHKEYADRGIRSVGLSPGTVATDMQVSIRESGINPVSQLDPSVHKPAEWVAKAVAYLCTDAGAGYAGGDFSLKTEEALREIGVA